MSAQTTRPAQPDGERALLADGVAVVVRRLTPDDRRSVDELHRGMPLEDRYMRFFTASRVGAEAAADIVLAPEAVAVGAFAGDRLLGVAHYRRSPAGTDPELALVVAHSEHHRGVASLLIEHIAAVARAEGVERFTAEVLAANYAMIEVLRNLGMRVSLRRDAEVSHVLVDLEQPGVPQERYADAVLDRTVQADLRSLRSVLEPRSVAVIGAGRRPGSVGRAILRSIVSGAFAGDLHVVHPRAARLGGVPCVHRVADLPRDVDLAILCVPAWSVPSVAEQCGEQGVRALVVITAGVDPAAGLAAAVRRHGMRLVGPGSAGLVNTARPVRLQASLAAAPVEAGVVGVAAQSCGLLLALQAELHGAGIGVSSTLSAGGGADVNLDDMLMWWAADARTEAAVLQVESLRRPRQFARLARRLATRMPVLVVRPRPEDRDAAVRDALFTQAGLLTVDDPGAVPGLLAVLRQTPLPSGRRVAVVSNSGGLGRTAAAACVRHGLSVATPGPRTHAVLHTLLRGPTGAADLTDVVTTVAPAAFGRAVELLLDDPAVDAVIAIGVRTGAGDPVAGIGPVLDAGPLKPVIVVRPGRPEAVAPLTAPADGRTNPRVLALADAGAAVAALAAAARRAGWLRRGSAALSPPPDADGDRARSVVAEALHELPTGGQLDPARTRMLAAATGLKPPVRMTDGSVPVIRTGNDPDVGSVLSVDPTGAGRIEDVRHRLLPVTDPDLDDLPADLRDALHRMAWLVEQVPEVAEAQLDGTAGLRVRLAPGRPTDPWLPVLPV